MRKIITIILVAFLAAGCATVGPSADKKSAAAALKRAPAKYEKLAVESLNKIIEAWAQGDVEKLAVADPRGLIRIQYPREVQAASLNLFQEAIWLEKDRIRLRASWSKDPQEWSGFGATRHMADFIFSVGAPSTLLAIEGENPFLLVGAGPAAAKETGPPPAAAVPSANVRR